MDFKAIEEQRTELLARRSESQRQYSRLHKQTSGLQARVGLNANIKEVLEELQRREHQRAVGTYEKLLTSIVQDVLPGYYEICLDLFTNRGLPALDLYSRKERGGQLEDIYNGNGGSVTNIISLGLRAISVIRSDKRRLLVLDESDCWIAPEVVPQFVQVVRQLAERMKIQVVMITHTKEEVLDVEHKLRLEKKSDGISVNLAPTSDMPIWEEGQKGIRSILLEDFQSHTCSFFPLSPGLTILSGRNDIGKSSIVAALRCVFLGEGKETFISHSQNSCRVTIDFGPEEHVLRWERHRTGKVIETFRHLTSDGSVIEATNGAKQVPQWVEDKFKIGLIEGLDVQLAHQKEPVFLLNKTDTIRAKALAIGEESSYIQSMMALDKKDIAEAKSSIKLNEQQMEQYQQVEYIIQPLITNKKRWEELIALNEQNQSRQIELSQLEALEQQWSFYQNESDTFELLSQNTIAPVPKLQLNPEFLRLFNTWEHYQKTDSILKKLEENSILDVPKLESQKYEQLFTKWEQNQSKYFILSQLKNHELEPVPQLKNAQQWVILEQKWTRQQKISEIFEALNQQSIENPPKFNSNEFAAVYNAWTVCDKEQRTLAEQTIRIDEEIKELEKTNILCPTCGQEWHPVETH